MREPKNRYERRVYRECLDAGYRQEMAEINEYANNIEDIYYSEHLGVWIVTFKNGFDDDQFDTKAQALEFIRQDALQVQP